MSVIYIQADDWEGLYFDGVLVDEGHSLNVSNVLSLLVGKTITGVSKYSIDQDYMEELGSLPESFFQLDLVMPLID